MHYINIYSRRYSRREDNKDTWHELNDLESIQKVPSKINSVFKHLGGFGENNIKVKLGD
ncbi:HNH endonuclease [Peribacillus frigoritolerans]|uniref:HNH endonuclease n=1 Tax=Peribacillus frigoritolerans TaxID=450367 RepID=UPI003873269B